MPKRSSKPKKEKPDANQNAFRILQEATVEQLKTEPPAKNPAAVALDRLGGLRGGRARAASLSKQERSAIAKKAAKARWRSPKP